MAQSFTRASPYLQQTAKQLASRDVKSWSYPLWAYVVGCIGVACICLFNGYITALLQTREQQKNSEKDLEAGMLAHVSTDGTCPDSMAKEPYMTNEDTSVLESEKKTSLPTKMKRVFQKLGKGKADRDNASMTAVNTSATNTTARNSAGSHARDGWKRDSKNAEIYEAHELDGVAVSRPDATPTSDTSDKAADDRIEFVERK